MTYNKLGRTDITVNKVNYMNMADSKLLYRNVTDNKSKLTGPAGSRLRHAKTGRTALLCAAVGSALMSCFMAMACYAGSWQYDADYAAKNAAKPETAAVSLNTSTDDASDSAVIIDPNLAPDVAESVAAAVSDTDASETAASNVDSADTNVSDTKVSTADASDAAAANTAASDIAASDASTQAESTSDTTASDTAAAASSAGVTGWWWKNDDGSYPHGEWAWIDGNGDGIAECYYFGDNGYMYADTVITDADGQTHTVNSSGAWVENGNVRVYPNQWVPGGKVLTANSTASVNSSALNPIRSSYSSENATHSSLTDAGASAILMQLKAEYPDGTDWDNSRQYISGKRYGYGCAAFVFLVQERLYGTPVRPSMTTELNMSELRVGDHLRVRNNTHSVIVLANYGDSIAVAEGNYNGKVRWGRVMTESELREQFVYRETCY